MYRQTSFINKNCNVNICYMRGFINRPQPIRVIDYKKQMIQSRQGYNSKPTITKQPSSFRPKKHESINSQISSDSLVSGSSMDESIVIEQGIYSNKNMVFKDHIHNLMLKQKNQAQSPGKPLKSNYLFLKDSVIEQELHSEIAESALGSSKGENQFVIKNELNNVETKKYSRQNSLAQTVANNKSRRTSQQIPINSFSITEKQTYKKPSDSGKQNSEQLMTIPKMGSLYDKFEHIEALNESNTLPISSVIKDKQFVSSSSKLKTPARQDSQGSGGKSVSFLSTERQLKIQSEVKRQTESKNQSNIKSSSYSKQKDFKINLIAASADTGSNKDIQKLNEHAKQSLQQDKKISTNLFKTLAPRISNNQLVPQYSEISSPLPSQLEPKVSDVVKLVFDFSTKRQNNQQIKKLRNGMASQKTLKLKDYLRLTSLSNDAKYDKYAAQSLNKIKRISQSSKTNKYLPMGSRKQPDSQELAKKQQISLRNKTTIDPCKSIVLIKASLKRSLSNMIESSTKLFNQLEQNRQLLGYQYQDLVFMCNFHRIYDENVLQPANLLRDLLNEFKKSRRKIDQNSKNLQFQDQKMTEPFSPRKKSRSPIK